MFVPEEIRATVLLRVVVLPEMVVVPEMVPVVPEVVLAVPEVVPEGLEVNAVMIREVFKGRKDSEKLVASSCCVPAAVLFEFWNTAVGDAAPVLVVIVRLLGAVLAAERGDMVA